MKPTRQLPALWSKTRRRLLRLKALVGEAARGTYHLDRTTAFITIELQSTWANFIRAYYLSCWRSPLMADGHRVMLVIPPGVSPDGLGFAVKRWRRSATLTPTGQWHRRDEPTWHDPNTLLTLAGDLSFSNGAGISAAFSSGTRVFLDLPVYRNFFAHRGEGTFHAAMHNAAIQYDITWAATPSKALLSRPPGWPQSLLADWIDDMVLTAAYMC